MNKLGFGAVVVGAAMLFAGAASAGYKWVSNVYVVKNADGSGYGYGSAGSARNSADTNQLVRCTIYSGYVGCTLMNSVGTRIDCTTSDPAMMTVARSFGTDSYLYFSVDTSGTCTYMRVMTDSGVPPKAL